MPAPNGAQRDGVRLSRRQGPARGSTSVGEQRLRVAWGVELEVDHTHAGRERDRDALRASRFDRVRLGAPVGTGAPKRRVDEDYSVVAAAGDSKPAVMGDGLNPLTTR